MSRAFCEYPRRCGKRLCHGVWPPSNAGPFPPPERTVWPLPPSPAVLTMPEPCPRPTRVRFGRDCLLGMIWLKVSPPLEALKPEPRETAAAAVVFLATAFVLDFALAVDFFFASAM